MTTPGSGVSLLELAFLAPVVAADGRARVVHAVSFESAARGFELGYRRKTFDAVCGARGRLVFADYPRDDGGTHRSLPSWPPRVRTLKAAGWRRCDECMAGAGVRRPRSTLIVPAVAVLEGAA